LDALLPHSAPDTALLSAALGTTVDEPLARRLAQYLDLLQRWNSVYNLTSVRTRESMLTQHLLDCLAIVRPLTRQAMPKPGARWLDVGSGGGLPGVVLAACLPQVQMVCVDTVAKKAAFIRQTAAQLGLGNLHAIHSRVEAMPEQPFQLITSRAFASLVDFTHLTQHLLAPDGVWLAMKGKTPADEMAALPDGIDVFHVEPLKVPGLDALRCLVWMKKKGNL